MLTASIFSLMFGLQHALGPAGISFFEDVQREGTDGDPHHALVVVEELDGLGVQREVVGVLIVEKVDGVIVELEGEGLQEGDVVRHHLFVGKIKLVHNDGVDVVVRQQVIERGLVADVLEEDVERLQELDANVAAALLLHDLQEEGQHVLLQEEVEDGAVILVAPDEDLGDGAQRLHQDALVLLRHRLVLGQQVVQVLEVLQRVRVFRFPEAAGEPAFVAKHGAALGSPNFTESSP